VELDEKTVARERPVNTFKIFVMDLKEIEARNGCAGEGQQQFDRAANRPIERMLCKDYDRNGSVAKISLVVSLKGLDDKTN
jgi:hypothetical protein